MTANYLPGTWENTPERYIVFGYSIFKYFFLVPMIYDRVPLTYVENRIFTTQNVLHLYYVRTDDDVSRRAPRSAHVSRPAPKRSAAGEGVSKHGSSSSAVPIDRMDDFSCELKNADLPPLPTTLTLFTNTTS